jgi:hypothetical protein
MQPQDCFPLPPSVRGGCTCNERIIADPETGVIYLPPMVMDGRRDGAPGSVVPPAPAPRGVGVARQRAHPGLPAELA